MGYEKKSGLKTYLQSAARGTLIEGDATTPLAANAWFEIESVAPAGSTIPIGKISGVFKTPDTTESAITPASGDNVYPLTLTRVCKTDLEITAEEGTIDVTDDCSGGYNDMILDGFATVSGTANGFLSFNDETGELESVTVEFLKKFFNVVTDDGAGGYVVTAKSNEKLLLFILLNRDAGVGDVQNWIIVPALFSSLGTGAALKDAQKRDLAWTKAEGYISLYQRTVFAADVVTV